MFAESDLVPLSALQHVLVCPRQCALIHLESVWLENRLTAEGRVAHERVDQAGRERRPGWRRACAVPLRSLTLGIAGRADVVEFRLGPAAAETPFPVEYKRGKPKVGDEDRVQLCAQAMCLEEMLGVPVPEGALFYGERRRRTPVTFDESLRQLTRAAAEAVHALFRSGATPPPPPAEAPCDNCSLAPACRPEAVRRAGRRPVAAWVRERLAEAPADQIEDRP